MTDEEIVAALAAAVGRDRSRDGIAAALLPTVRRIAEQRAAEVAAETAHKWQYGAWLGLPGPVEQQLASGQFVTEWLRARAAALTATPNHGTEATT